MKTTKLIQSVLLLSCLACTSVSMAGDIYVISNSSLSLGAGDTRDVFLGDTQFVGKVALLVIDNSGIKADFTDKVLGMEADKYRTYWAKKSFRDGVKIPTQKTSDNDVITLVKATPGAVGYVSSQPSGVNVIKKY